MATILKNSKTETNDAFNPEVLGGWLTKSWCIAKWLFIIGLSFVFIPKMMGSHTSYVDPPGKVSCDEYSVGSITKRRWQDFATLTDATNGCVAVELNDEPFVLHFNPASRSFRYYCSDLENGIFHVEVFCPGMERPIVIENHNYNFDLTKASNGACGQSPLRLIGMAKCVFRMN